MNILAVILLAGLIYYIWVADYSNVKPETTPVSTPTPPPTNAIPSVSNILSSISGTTNKLVNDIINTANANNLNPAILYGIVSAEQGTTNPNEWNISAYNPSDPSGAYGLTQVLGDTAQSLNVNPEMLLQSPQMALNTTAQYILKYTPATQTNNISVVAGIYNGGPGIFNEINNGTANSGTINAVGTYIEKAGNGYNYFNSTYGGSQ
jgi:hypothetical protein